MCLGVAIDAAAPWTKPPRGASRGSYACCAAPFAERPEASTWWPSGARSGAIPLRCQPALRARAADFDRVDKRFTIHRRARDVP